MVLKAQPTLINERDPDKGDTTLICSVEKGNLPLVQLMMDFGAKIDDTNNLGNTALIVACSKRYPCIVTELINRKASINIANKKGNRAISFVCQMGPLKTLEFLIANGAEIEFFNINGDTPFLIACRNGQAELVKLLIQYYNKTIFFSEQKLTVLMPYSLQWNKTGLNVLELYLKMVSQLMKRLIRIMKYFVNQHRYI